MARSAETDRSSGALTKDLLMTSQIVPSFEPKATSRRDAPVFVLGAVRSGTTLLYHMLLSSGNFAVYRTESNALNLLEPRFGDLSRHRNQRRLLDAWYKSRLFSLSGVEKSVIEARVMAECRHGGDFLRIVMEEIARRQGVKRWADTTPEHLLHLKRIKQTIPNALIIHVIRDGRDVALSADKLGWVRRLPWDRTPSVIVAGLYWQWMVNKGRAAGRQLGNDYIEVRFEDMIAQPQATLRKLGEFVDHDLDYDRIQKVGVGSVGAPNTSFPAEDFEPVGRWRKGYAATELAALESLIGGTLEKLGYTLATDESERSAGSRDRLMYQAYFDSKLYLKTKTPLGRWFTTRDLSWI